MSGLYMYQSFHWMCIYICVLCLRDQEKCIGTAEPSLYTENRQNMSDVLDVAESPTPPKNNVVTKPGLIRNRGEIPFDFHY